MPDALRILLGPVLAVQGKRLYQRIPRMPEPSGDRRGEVGTGPELRLLVVGDSSGAGVGVGTQDEALLGQTVARLAEDRRVTFRLEARHGSTIPRTLQHLRKQEPEPFDDALVALGINDITAGRPLDKWLASYRELVEELRERFSVQRVIVSGLPPIGEFPAIPNPLQWYLGRTARRYDAALKAWADTESDIVYIDFETVPGDPLHDVPMAEVMASDGFHPGPKIYDEWGRRAAVALAQ
ncbi:SGNH/GDSL hydrolase family protein [Rubrivirga sp.]|uniref:SGNH/GDSL hydrolase family protein n=1 Tax=Rubrivirga sp. TaxID=1885344 RepID=UPI003C7944C8